MVMERNPSKQPIANLILSDEKSNLYSFIFQ